MWLKESWGFQFKNDRIEGCLLISSCKKTKFSISNFEQPLTEDTETHQKKIPYVQRRRSHSEMVGGVQLQSNKIPYPLGGWPTDWRIVISKKFSHYCEGSEPHVRLSSLGIQQRDWGPRESCLEGQWDLITGLLEEWVKQRLWYWRAQTKFCAHQDAEERSSDPTGDWDESIC